MARPVTVTKERILSTAIDLLRSGGPSALTARGLCTRLGCGASAIFSSFGSIQGVREAHPDLTKGDIRAYILSHLQFSVSEQAVLLGISSASVTKARQRFKAKMQA